MMQRIKKEHWVYGLLLLVILVLIGLYLVLENNGNWDYILPLRSKKLIAFIIVGISTTVATISFQTLAQNNILTPSILGLDSLYVLFQTMILFFYGSNHLVVRDKQINFLISVVLMVGISFVLYQIVFRKYSSNLYLLMMVGMIAGTFFRSVSTFLQVLMDPNEFDKIQGKLFASFNNIDVALLGITLLIGVAALMFLFSQRKVLDVLHLGRDQAVNLGVNVEGTMLKVLVLVAILTSISTALVGPITFLGFMVANLTYRIFKTYQHGILFIGGSFLSIIVLLVGQLVVERVFHLTTTLSVVIEFLGGCYFIYLLIKERKRE
ncbi:iron chelate uptake ABC transporter family permease subunit [Carnobacterium maltaromaticum]|uniref:iron chelate uptake ABC transporter family permease subunit n=1 Tax=Carnobacterium maltaromaticum TaxID=2751 RepID=UPI00295E5ACC|nr:iron chelate uptake ABC transporter family permease subunit [Carnobacterium maltaromaticum]